MRWDTQLVRERGGERKRVPWPQHAHLLRRLSHERRRAAGAPLRAVPRPGPRERLGRPRTAPDNILKYTLSRARAKRIKTDALSLPLSPLHPNSGGDGRGSAFFVFLFFFSQERGGRDTPLHSARGPTSGAEGDGDATCGRAARSRGARRARPERSSPLFRRSPSFPATLRRRLLSSAWCFDYHTHAHTRTLNPLTLSPSPLHRLPPPRRVRFPRRRRRRRHPDRALALPLACRSPGLPSQIPRRRWQRRQRCRPALLEGHPGRPHLGRQGSGGRAGHCHL